MRARNPRRVSKRKAASWLKCGGRCGEGEREVKGEQKERGGKQETDESRGLRR